MALADLAATLPYLASGYYGGSLQGLQALLTQQNTQQQLATQAAAQQAAQHFYEAQAEQARVDALDRQIAQDDAFFRDPEALIRSGLAQPELLQNAVNVANLRRRQRGYTGVDLSYHDISRTVQDFRRKYPSFYGGAGYVWDEQTQRYVQTPLPPAPTRHMPPMDVPVSAEQYQQRGPMGPANFNARTGDFPQGPPMGDAYAPGMDAAASLPAGMSSNAIAPLLNAAAGSVNVQEVPPGQGQAQTPAPAPAVGAAQQGNTITVPGIDRPITIPDSMYAAAAFNPQTMAANLLQAGFSPEHASALAASQQAGLIERAKQEMGIAQLPLTLQQAALGMAGQAADIKLKLAQAYHEQNQPLVDFYQAQLKSFEIGQKQQELEETGRHQLTQDQQTELAHAQSAVQSEEGSRMAQVKTLGTQADQALQLALAATNKVVSSEDLQRNWNLGGGPIGTLFTLGSAVGMTEVLKTVAAGQGSKTFATLFQIFGRKALPGLAALGAAGLVIQSMRKSDGTTQHLVTYQGQHLILERPETQRYLQLAARQEALSSIPPRPIPQSWEQYQLSQQPITPALKSLVRAMVESPGKTDRRGNAIPNFQDAYYSAVGQSGYSGELAGYRLIQAYQALYPNRPIPIRIGQPGSPGSPLPQEPYQYDPFSAGKPTTARALSESMQRSPVGPMSPSPGGGVVPAPGPAPTNPIAAFNDWRRGVAGGMYNLDRWLSGTPPPTNAGPITETPFQHYLRHAFNLQPTAPAK